MTIAQYDVIMADVAAGDVPAHYKYNVHARSLIAANALLQLVEEAITTLETFPERGAYPPELFDAGNRDFRQLIVWPYRLIYRISRQEVQIVAIIDGRRNVQQLLQQRLLRP